MQRRSKKLSIQQLAAIDQLADRFEKQFCDGREPCIEDYLSEESPELRPHLLRELLNLELRLRRDLCQMPLMEDYIQRFSDHRSIVESLFMTTTYSSTSTIDHAKSCERESPIEGSVPERIGRYVIKRQLGMGGFGVVYLALDQQLDRPVALKVPRRERFATQHQVEEFIQEARTTAKLKHQLLVTIFDVQEIDGLPVIVQEYIEGENLADWSVNHQPSYEEIARVLSDVADAVGYAHQHRLTHCDLKLANVLMDRQGKPHVADFGLAVHESMRLQRKGACFGTPHAMAPEQVRGEGHRLDGRTDIWALGVMMYQLLVSERPFTATERKELFNEIETLDPRPPRQINSNVPRELESICLKCLSKKRTDRYNTTEDLRHDLRRWLAQQPSHRIPQGLTIFSREVATNDTNVNVHARRSTQPASSPEDINPNPLRKHIHLPYPSLGNFFKGRDDVIQRLAMYLDAPSDLRQTKLICLYGLGGVGKTRLCVEYAWQNATKYRTVLFAVADSPDNIRRNISELANTRHLDLPEQELTDEDKRFSAVVKYLQSSSPWLLILDNVDDERSAEAVEELASSLYGGHTLITTRMQRWSSAVELMELDLLHQSAAEGFLLERTQRVRRAQSDDVEYARRLVTQLGCLALALEQAAAYIVTRRQSFAQYLAILQTHSLQVRTWHDARLMKYSKSLAATWQASVDQLEPSQRLLLDILAWFAPDPIPVAALRNVKLVESLQQHRELHNELPGQLENDLGVLADFSLIRWYHENDTIEMHRVVQEIIRSYQPSPANLVKKVVELLCSAAPVGDPSDVRTWADWEPLVPHALFACGQADRFEINVPTSRLMGELGILLWRKALHSQAESLERRALALDEREFGHCSHEVAIRLGNLAQTLQALNRYHEAEPLLRRSLEIVEQLHGPHHADVARDLNNLARFLHETNRLAEAESLLRRSVEIYQATEGADTSLAIALSNLAQLLRDTDRTTDAEPLLQRALRIDEQHYGNSHPEVAHDLNSLGRLLHATGRVAEAETLLRRALAIDIQAYGHEHPDVARDMGNLARVLQDTQRMDEADAMFRRALEINEQYLGDAHPDVALDLCNLARLLLVSGRATEGEQLLKRCLQIYEEFRILSGFEHPRMHEALALLS